ncbi:hypothetical protein MXD61_04845 [Frankia sp. AgPm24]|nr:hypothetical protein [Frankia sp. AgPm24]
MTGRCAATAAVVERDGDLVLLVRDGALPSRTVSALRAVLAPVAGRIVGRDPAR